MARTSSPSKKRFTLAVVAVLIFSGAGAAFAYWTSTGEGAGTAETGTSAVFTIAADPAVGTISPGGAGQTVDFTVTNPGPGVQALTTVTVALADAAGTAWVPPTGCDIADYTASVTTAPPAGAIAAGADVSGQVTVTLANTSVNQDACQGETAPLYFSAS
jgi:hypothetical protein